MKWFILFGFSIVTLVSCQQQAIDDTRFRSDIIFPYQEEHVHGSTLVNLPNGDVLSAWFQGSGERWADDVRIMGSRLVKGDTAWSRPFVMADVNGFPDINPILFMDKKERLWLMWYPVLANQWETSIPMYRISENYNAPGAPVWSWQEVLFVKVGDKTERGIQPNDLFVKEVNDQLKLYEEYLKSTLMPSYPDSMKHALLKEWDRYEVKMDSLSKGENMIRSGRMKTDNAESSGQLGYPLTRRLGWQTKNKAIFLGDRMIVPLYSDGFDCSLFAITDDGGQTWSYSNPVLGGAGIQATIAIGKDSLLVAYLRDNGPPPNRMQRTESRDKGLTWTIAKDDILPNPGAGFDIVTLSTGEWVMVFNDTENGRHNLSVAVSDDEGKSWKWKKSIENDKSEKPTSSHYPAIIADSRNRIYITYSYHRNDIKPGRTIKYVSFPVSYLKNE
ncbi:MAG TPA: exo-alpha-sialidase [Chryseolinea sp.]|nr:exo-alpha-sialidase [Chryseolinea sp.]